MILNFAKNAQTTPSQTTLKGIMMILGLGALAAGCTPIGAATTVVTTTAGVAASAVTTTAGAALDLVL